MDEELKNTQINTPENKGIAPDIQDGTSTEGTAPNSGWDEIVGQYAPGIDASNPQQVLDAMLPVIQKMIAMEGKIKDACSNSPETAAFISDLIDTGNVSKSIARNFSQEERQALLDEVNDSEYDEDRSSFSDKVKVGKDRQAELKGNQDVSIAEISSFYEEKGWSEDQADDFSQKVDAFATDLFDGKITKVHLSQLEKAFNYDGDIATAEENGKIIGKNDKITSTKKTREDLKELLPEGGMSGSSIPVRKQTYAESLNSTSPLKKLNI